MLGGRPVLSPVIHCLASRYPPPSEHCRILLSPVIHCLAYPAILPPCSSPYPLLSSRPHATPLLHVCSENGYHLATSCETAVHVWDLRKLKVIHTIDVSGRGVPHAVAFDNGAQVGKSHAAACSPLRYHYHVCLMVVPRPRIAPSLSMQVLGENGDSEGDALSLNALPEKAPPSSRFV